MILKDYQKYKKGVLLLFPLVVWKVRMTLRNLKVRMIKEDSKLF
jgi:hypothetical protein